MVKKRGCVTMGAESIERRGESFMLPFKEKSVNVFKVTEIVV